MVINNIEFNTNKVVISKILENAIVNIYDNANNMNTYKCTTYYSPKNPSGNESIIKKADTSTLKVWIEKKIEVEELVTMLLIFGLKTLILSLKCKYLIILEKNC